VLLQHGIKTGSAVTSYPSVKKELEAAYKYDDHARVVVDGNLITSRGPGTALEFSLALVQATVGKETADKLAAGMLLHPGIHA
jgi:protein DJ-1